MPRSTFRAMMDELRTVRLPNCSVAETFRYSKQFDKLNNRQVRPATGRHPSYHRATTDAPPPRRVPASRPRQLASSHLYARAARASIATGLLTRTKRLQFFFCFCYTLHIRYLQIIVYFFRKNYTKRFEKLYLRLDSSSRYKKRPSGEGNTETETEEQRP